CGQGVGLPSGEAVARYIGVAPLTAGQIGIASTGWRGETPPWYYLLRESEACAGGRGRGAGGGGIVADGLCRWERPRPARVWSNAGWQPRKTLSELLAS